MAKFSAKVTLDGEKALLRTLSRLNDRAAGRALEKAADYAVAPIIKSAREKVSKRSGLTRKALGKKKLRHRRGAGVTLIIGARTNVTGEFEGRKHVPAFTAHLVEGGHINADGTFTPPRPFLRPAFEETGAEVKHRMERRLGHTVRQEAFKAAGGRR